MRTKKGSVVDTIFYVVVIFLLSLLTILGYRVLTDVNDNLQGQDAIPDAAKSRLQGFSDNYATLFDYAFLTVVIFLFIAVLLSGMLVDVHPAVYFIAVFLLFFVLTVAAIFGNAYVEFEENTALSDYAADFTIIPFVLHHFVEIIIVFGFAIAIITYARVRMSY